MNQSPVTRFAERIPAPIVLIFALVLIQVGSGLAKTVMSADNVFGLGFVRLALGALVLGVLIRPRLRALTRAQWIDAGFLGLAFAAFNVTAYLALVNLPLGLVATIGFLGPLAISIAGSRRLLEFVWPVLGFTGVALLAPTDDTASVSWQSMGYGLAYAGAWAAYILASARAGKSMAGLDGFAIASAIAAILVAPLGIADAGYFFSSWSLGLMTLLVALFAIVPFGLEFIVLKRMPPRVFGTLLSLEPAIASIAGIFILGELLSLKSWIAVGAVSVASVGATMVLKARTKVL